MSVEEEDVWDIPSSYGSVESSSVPTLKGQSKEITRTISFLYICARRGNVLSVEQYKKKGGETTFISCMLKRRRKELARNNIAGTVHYVK